MSLPNMNSGPVERIVNRLSQHLASHWSGIPFAQCQILQDIDDGISLRPPKVGVRKNSGGITQVQQQCRNSVWNRRTLAPQHVVPVRL